MQCVGYPAHRIEDPPTSPPHPRMGAQLGGARWDDRRTAAAIAEGRRSNCGRCASLSGAVAAAQATTHTTSSGTTAADVPSSEPQVSDWRGGRAAASTTTTSAARLRAWRVSGVTIWPAWRDRQAQRRECNAGQFVKQALVHAQREGIQGPAIPGHGLGPPSSGSPAASAWPICARDRSPIGARRAAARRAAQQPGPAQADAPRETNKNLNSQCPRHRSAFEVPSTGPLNRTSTNVPLQPIADRHGFWVD
jgi:hypothetical protein